MLKKQQKTKDKIIFLDADGVMNGIRNWPLTGAPRWWIDPKAVTRLNNLTKRSGAKLVISSTWRRFWDVPSILKRAGVVAPVVGETPYLPGRERGIEIRAWLSQHPDVESYVILDDDSDMGELVDHLVLTDWDLGIQDKHVEMAFRRLLS